MSPTPSKVPTIFSPARAHQRRRRMLTGKRDGQASFVLDEAVDDIIERLAFVRHEPACSLILGDTSMQLGRKFAEHGGQVMLADIVGYFDHFAFDLEQPYPQSGFDFIAVLGLLDGVNDLPGALIHMRNALTPGGMMIASFVGGGSLPQLRSAMLAADGDRPAARMHPLVDPRAAPGLLQRAGWKDPVVDTHRLTARYSSLDRLVKDLREQGLTNALSDTASPLSKAALTRARSAFLDQADADGKVSETFEIITLTGRRSLAGS